MEMVFDKQKRGTLLSVFFRRFLQKRKKVQNIINQILVGFEVIYNMILDEILYTEYHFKNKSFISQLQIFLDSPLNRKKSLTIKLFEMLRENIE